MIRAQLNRRSDKTFEVVGELTFETVPDLLGTQPFVTDLPGSHVLDLSGVKRADSAGIALLIEWARQARSIGNSVVYRGMSEQMMGIARVSNLEEVLPLDGGDNLPPSIT